MKIRAEELGRVSQEQQTGRRVQKRKPSGKPRLPVMHKFVLSPPVPVSDEWNAKIGASYRAIKDGPIGHSSARNSPLLQAAFDATPIDSRWYLVAIPMSKGEAVAFIHAVNYGITGHDGEAVWMKWDDLNPHSSRRHHLVFFRRHP